MCKILRLIKLIFLISGLIISIKCQEEETAENEVEEPTDTGEEEVPIEPPNSSQENPITDSGDSLPHKTCANQASLLIYKKPQVRIKKNAESICVGVEEDAVRLMKCANKPQQIFNLEKPNWVKSQYWGRFTSNTTGKCLAAGETDSLSLADCSPSSKAQLWGLLGSHGKPQLSLMNYETCKCIFNDEGALTLHECNMGEEEQWIIGTIKTIHVPCHTKPPASGEDREPTTEPPGSGEDGDSTTEPSASGEDGERTPEPPESGEDDESSTKTPGGGATTKRPKTTKSRITTTLIKKTTKRPRTTKSTTTTKPTTTKSKRPRTTKSTTTPKPTQRTTTPTKRPRTTKSTTTPKPTQPTTTPTKRPRTTKSTTTSKRPKTTKPTPTTTTKSPEETTTELVTTTETTTELVTTTETTIATTTEPSEPTQPPTPPPPPDFTSTDWCKTPQWPTVDIGDIASANISPVGTNLCYFIGKATHVDPEQQENYDKTNPRSLDLSKSCQQERAFWELKNVGGKYQMISLFSGKCFTALDHGPNGALWHFRCGGKRPFEFKLIKGPGTHEGQFWIVDVNNCRCVTGKLEGGSGWLRQCGQSEQVYEFLPSD